jgi:hypothetical protein
MNPEKPGVRMVRKELDRCLASSAKLDSVLAELCRRIAKQERRHFAWYYNGARERLARSALGDPIPSGEAGEHTLLGASGQDT